MAIDSSQLDSLLSTLVPIDALPIQYRKELLNQSRVLDYAKGSFVFREGEEDSFSYYLLKGELKLYVRGKFENRVYSGTGEARYALVHLKPRQHSAKAVNNVSILRIDCNLLDKLLTLSSTEQTEAEFEDTEIGDKPAGSWVAGVLELDLFKGIPPTNMQQIIEHLECIEIEAGEVIIKQGDPGDYFYIIDRGRCRISRQLRGVAQDIRLAELREGETFGEEALVTGAMRNATITAVTDSRLLRLTKGDFAQMIKRPMLSKVTFTEAQVMVRAGAVWLDVRVPEEREKSVISGSISMPLNTLRPRMSTLDQELRYIVFCETGGRSSVAAFLLGQRGFDVYYLAGGLALNPLACVGAEDKDRDKTMPLSEGKGAVKPMASVPEGEDVRLDTAVRASILSAELMRASLDIPEDGQLQEEAPGGMVYEEVNGVFQDERDTPRSEVERVQKDTHDPLSLAKQIQTKHEIEVAKRDAERIAEEIRQAEQHRVLELSNTVEERLVDRQKDLTAEYDRTMSELVRLSREKGDAARDFILHRQALIDGNTVLGEKIRLQKSDLEREFNHSMTAVEMARHQLEMGDAVQEAAAEEAEKIAAEYTAAWADGRTDATTPGNGAPSKDTFSLVQTTGERQGGGITAGKHQKFELSGEKPPVLQGDAVERRKRERDLVQARRIEETAAATKRHLEDTAELLKRELDRRLNLTDLP